MNIPQEIMKIAKESQSSEDQELIEKIAKKFNLSQDPMGKIVKFSLAFGEAPYNFTYDRHKVESEEEAPLPKFSNILSTNGYQLLGYECLESADTQ